MQSLFSFPFFHVRRLFHPFRLHPILIAGISAEKSFCMPFHHVALARRNTGEHTHRHGIVITVFFRTVSLVVHPHFTVPSFLFFSLPPSPPRVFFVSSIFFCASPYDSTTTTTITLRFYSISRHEKPNLGVSTHGVSTKDRYDVGVWWSYATSISHLVYLGTNEYCNGLHLWVLNSALFVSQTMVLLNGLLLNFDQVYRQCNINLRSREREREV